MLDNGIFGHSQFAEAATGPQGPRWGTQSQHCQVSGIIRKKLDPDQDYQAQKDSLFTVGRLIRGGDIDAFSYSELRYEGLRRIIGVKEFAALAGCKVAACQPALNRSRFQSGDFLTFARKGGKKDQKDGRASTLGQIPFMEMLCSLSESSIRKLPEFSAVLGLTEFEIASIRNLRCFQQFCKISQSPENFPDMFHLWTAQRNRMDVFLTLEKRLPSIAKQIENSRDIAIEYPTKVLRPLEFLRSIGIERIDPVPIEPDRFYPLIDIWKSDAKP